MDLMDKRYINHPCESEWLVALFLENMGEMPIYLQSPCSWTVSAGNR